MEEYYKKCHANIRADPAPLDKKVKKEGKVKRYDIYIQSAVWYCKPLIFANP